MELQKEVDAYLAQFAIEQSLEPASDVAEIEEKFGDTSEKLAQNAAMLWVVALSEVRNLIQRGPAHERLVLSQESRAAANELIDKMTKIEERKPGYSLLATMYASYENYDSTDQWIQTLIAFKKDLNFLSMHFDELDPLDRQSLQDSLLDRCELFMKWGDCYLEGVLDNRPMVHEGGDLSDFHSNLYRSYQIAVLFDHKHSDGTPRGTSQFYRRRIYEARYLFPALAPQKGHLKEPIS